MQQLSLIPAEKPVHGGDHKLGQRKTLRPLACDRPIHLILKAREAFQADIGAAVLENARRIAEKFRIRIFDHAVGHDHVHLVLKIPHRREYVKFIRALTGVLARKFGIEFLEKKQADAEGKSKLTLSTASGGWFTPGLKFYAVDVAPLQVTAAGAESLLSERSTPILVSAPVGRGRVVALGDPWLYNEYLYTQDNRRLAEELFRKLLR